MGIFFRLIAACFLIFFLSSAAILYLAIENKPHVEKTVDITPEHIARIKHIIDNHRHKTQSGKIATVSILPEDLDIVINYLTHLVVNGRAQAALGDGEALLRLSYPIPGNVLRGYLNFETTFTDANHFPLPQSIRIGSLRLPEYITNRFTQQFLHWLENNHPEFRAGLDTLQQIRISQESLSIVYRWKEGLFDKASKIAIGMPVISKQEQARVLRYHHMLINNYHFKSRAAIPLSELLTHAMRLASKHSINGNNPIAENRAAILATAFHVLGLPLKLLFPEVNNLPKPANLKVTLDGRDDFAKHFMVSAAITAYADTMLSDAIGLYKEIEDSRSGSGFSFNDMAANRAGVRFAEQAIASQVSALRIQKVMATKLKDTDLMPTWSDLPEFMSESEFAARFGGIDTPKYQQLMKKIEQRIAALRILH